MTKQRDLKALVRERMSKTGESYTTARRHVTAQPARAPDTPREGAVDGWFLAGSARDDYEFARDDKPRDDGAPSVALRSKGEAPGGFGTFMQEFVPAQYRGLRVRFAAEVEARDVRGWAGLWMRVDGPNKATRAFDNMRSRALRGSAPWRRYEVVLDVARDAEVLAFGLLLEGAGAVRLAHVSLEAVSDAVPTTGHALAEQPRNLDFRE